MPSKMYYELKSMLEDLEKAIEEINKNKPRDFYEKRFCSDIRPNYTYEDLIKGNTNKAVRDILRRSRINYS